MNLKPETCMGWAYSSVSTPGKMAAKQRTWRNLSFPIRDTLPVSYLLIYPLSTWTWCSRGLNLESVMLQWAPLLFLQSLQVIFFPLQTLLASPKFNYKFKIDSFLLPTFSETEYPSVVICGGRIFPGHSEHTSVKGSFSFGWVNSVSLWVYADRSLRREPSRNCSLSWQKSKELFQERQIC